MKEPCRQKPPTGFGLIVRRLIVLTVVVIMWVIVVISILTRSLTLEVLSSF